MTAIELDGVTKRFGDGGKTWSVLRAGQNGTQSGSVTALRDLDMTVEEGEVFGFLGPNGAGKSTTINVLLDFVRPTSGTARVLGHDVHEESVAVRRRTGVLPEGFDVYDRLTARQHVRFAVHSKDVDDDPAAVLERVGLEDAIDRKASGFSTGMRQRLALAMALVGEPDLLVLDEPSSGLDPNGAREMRGIVREEADRGATVFFSSHILGQVEPVCDRVGILRDGELVATDSIEGLREASDADTSLEIEVDRLPDGALDRVREVDGVTDARADGNVLTVSCDDDAKTAVLGALEDAGATVEDFSTQEASLEELFATYTEARA